LKITGIYLYSDCEVVSGLVSGRMILRHPDQEIIMGLLGKVVAVKAVKGRRDDKKEKKEGQKEEEKKE
jgi:hypothetical protein